MNEENVKENGILLDDFNNIPSEKWNELLNNSKKIRFAYYLEIEDENDDILIDELIINFNIKGKWFSQIEGEDYDYDYLNNRRLVRVRLYNNGNYKINYFKPIIIEEQANKEVIYEWEEFSL